MATKEQAVALFKAVQAIADAIREAKQIPAGTLYALLMPHGCTLERFDWIVGILVESGRVVRDSSHLLRWVD